MINVLCISFSLHSDIHWCTFHSIFECTIPIRKHFSFELTFSISCFRSLFRTSKFLRLCWPFRCCIQVMNCKFENPQKICGRIKQRHQHYTECQIISENDCHNSIVKLCLRFDNWINWWLNIWFKYWMRILKALDFFEILQCFFSVYF